MQLLAAPGRDPHMRVAAACLYRDDTGWLAAAIPGGQLAAAAAAAAAEAAEPSGDGADGTQVTRHTMYMHAVCVSGDLLVGYGWGWWVWGCRPAGFASPGGICAVPGCKRCMMAWGMRRGWVWFGMG